MIENRVRLISNHPYNFRHGTNEKPIIIDVVAITVPAPKYTVNAEPRFCYKVKYPDGYVDLVPVSECVEGNWHFEVSP